MAGVALRTVGHGGVGGDLTPTHKRGIFTLSDGTRAAVIADPNQNNISGDGGDNSNVAKFYIYTSPNGVNWTLRATVTPTTAPLPNAVTWAACIGSNNNIHLCWRTTAGGIAYRLITFAAGPTYTVGAEETVLSTFPTNGNTAYVRRLDMDVAGSGNNAVIAAYCALTASATIGNRRNELRCFTRSNTPSWVAAPVTPFTSNGQWYYLGSEDVTIAADAAGPDGSNQINCVVLVTRKRNDGGDLGDCLFKWRTNVSTGASVSMTFDVPSAIGFQGVSVGVGGGIRTYYAYASAPGEFTILGMTSITPSTNVFVWRFNLSSGGVRTDLIPRQNVNFAGNAFDRTSVLYGWGGASYGNDSGVIHCRSTNYIYAIPLQFFRAPTHRVRVGQVRLWDEGYTFGGARAQSIVGVGTNRNFGYNYHDVLWFSGLGNGINWYKVEFFQVEYPQSPRNVIPAANATSSTDRPTIGGDHYWGTVNLPQTRTKMQWQLASDAGFSSNLRTVTEEDADFLLAQNTASPNNARVPTTELLPSLAELFQGTWYIRARSITELGDAGAWSNGQAFVVTHPPAVTDTYPRNDSIFDYGGSGNITFSWKFTDPSPTDFQTAYQIIVEDAETESIIFDTGKVTSSEARGTHSVPAPGKDIQLRWKIRLWDSDDVVGIYSTYQTFYTVDKPGVSVDYPTGATANQLSADDSGFDATVGTWQALANAGAPVRSTAQFRTGPASLQATATGAGNVVVGTSGTAYPCYPGQELTAGGWSRANTTARQVQMLFRFFDVNGTYMSGFDVNGTNATDNNTGWTQVPTRTTFAPAGAASYQVCVQRIAMAAAESFFIDDITAGDTGNINTAMPTVRWTVAIGGGRTQKNYRVVITQGSTTVYNSGWQLSSLQAHTIPVGYLLNSSPYTVTVYVRDNLDLESSASAQFNTVWNLPAAPSFTVNINSYETLGYVVLSWTNAAIDPDFVAWNIYRRLVGETSWTLLSQEIVDQPSYTYNDYLAASNQDYQYMVVQLVDRFGSLVESATTPTLVHPVSTVYWLIHPTNASLSIPLRFVTDDPYTVEYDQAVYNIIGKGRHVDYGDKLGVSGVLTAKLRDLTGGLTARQQRELLLELRDEQINVYLRNPFGDIWQVAMGDIGVARLSGVGLNEYVDVTIPYQEVA